ncbi:hypothetical protein KKD19_05810 [Patescibacteria group bacterium]|nr:hypothetical protein [Patescibacteria group bacterium]MBU4512719.1 hypothetical protein [Patescibacteria group bacterium]MCG2693656.1 hypothetical protein [Candidatus Parcubacteria bacterium]
MIQKLFLCFCVFCVFALAAGCSTSEQKIDEPTAEDKTQVEGTSSEARPFNNEMFSEANLSALEIGLKVSIMGAENSDGSIAANQIMIGDSETNFGELGGNMQFGGRNASNTNLENSAGNQPSQPPQNFEGQRGNFEQFQNMTEEERTKLREEMTAQRGGAGMRPNSATGATRMNRGGGTARLNGEIIDKDDVSITLKLEDGGSKLVFYSDATKILKVKEQ